MAALFPTPRFDLSAGLLIQMMRYAGSIGLDVGDLLRSQGIDPSLLLDPDGRIPAERYIAVENEAARRSGDELFGFHYGTIAEPGNYSILVYLMMNCENLGQAVRKYDRYKRIVGNLFTVRAEPGPGRVTFVYESLRGAPAVSRHDYESMFAGTFKIIRTITGKRVNPVEVRLAFPAPRSRAEHIDFFGCPVAFDAERNSVAVDSRIDRIPLVQPNVRLREYFEKYAGEVCAGLEDDRPVTRAVVEHILSRIDDESLTIRRIAKVMAVSVRTLQVRLREEGAAFSDILDDTRMHLARAHLKDNLTVDETACLVGFSDSSAFRKAFKKWTGMTPTEFRKRRDATGNAR